MDPSSADAPLPSPSSDSSDQAADTLPAVDPLPAEPDRVGVEPDPETLDLPLRVEPNPEALNPTDVEPDPEALDPTDGEPNPEALDPTDGEPDPESLDPTDVEPNPEALDPPAPAGAPAAEAAGAGDPAAAGPGHGRRGRKGKGGGEAKPASQPAAKRPANSPDPAEVTRRIGSTNAAALRYVLSPDPQLSRLSRKVREALITDIPPVTAGALLGPEALARHFVASAAAGRYRDLFALWELFRARPEACKPVLAERQRALERARQALTTAVRLGLRGRADRVVGDIAQAEGLIWTWLRDALTSDLAAVGRRPQVVAALLAREPGLDIPLPQQPSDAWLAEAAAAKQSGEVPSALDALLAGSIDRLPATVATLSLVSEHYPERLPALVDRIDLSGPDIGSIQAWARDHGVADRITSRVAGLIADTAAHDRAGGLAIWQAWRERGVEVPLPESLQSATIEGLDLARPESAFLVRTLVDRGADLDPQGELDALAQRNRQLAEKAYEAFVCAELDVHLPLALEGNPIVRDGTRCPACQAWTWVRPGHERRCPRRREEERTPA